MKTHTAPVRRKRRILLACIAGVLAAFAAILLVSRFYLITTQYTLSVEGIVTPVKIVCLSDLHGLEFGKNNSHLLEKVQAAQPDLIAVVGDMLPKQADAESLHAFSELLSALQAMAPVYVSYGNVEKETPDFAQTVADSGAVLLDECFTQITVRDTELRLGGLYNYAFRQTKTPEQWAQTPTNRFLREFENTNLPTVLLCHRPDSFIFFEAYNDYDIDLLLCGHTHGGVIRIPFIGGLVATDQDVFPPYDYGQFQLGDMQMVITSGFAGYRWIPRVFNPPEIACVTLQAAN